MCQIETIIYVHPSGGHKEKVTYNKELCEKSVNGKPCQNPTYHNLGERYLEGDSFGSRPPVSPSSLHTTFMAIETGSTLSKSNSDGKTSEVGLKQSKSTKSNRTFGRRRDLKLDLTNIQPKKDKKKNKTGSSTPRSPKLDRKPNNLPPAPDPPPAASTANPETYETQRYYFRYASPVVAAQTPNEHEADVRFQRSGDQSSIHATAVESPFSGFRKDSQLFPETNIKPPSLQNVSKQPPANTLQLNPEGYSEYTGDGQSHGETLRQSPITLGAAQSQSFGRVADPKPNATLPYPDHNDVTYHINPEGINRTQPRKFKQQESSNHDRNDSGCSMVDSPRMSRHEPPVECQQNTLFRRPPQPWAVDEVDEISEPEPSRRPAMVFSNSSHSAEQREANEFFARQQARAEARRHSFANVYSRGNVPSFLPQQGFQSQPPTTLLSGAHSGSQSRPQAGTNSEESSTAYVHGNAAPYPESRPVSHLPPRFGTGPQSPNISAPFAPSNPVSAPGRPIVFEEEVEYTTKQAKERNQARRRTQEKIEQSEHDVRRLSELENALQERDATLRLRQFQLDQAERKLKVYREQEEERLRRKKERHERQAREQEADHISERIDALRSEIRELKTRKQQVNSEREEWEPQYSPDPRAQATTFDPRKDHQRRRSEGAFASSSSRRMWEKQKDVERKMRAMFEDMNMSRERAMPDEESARREAWRRRKK